MCVPFWPFRVFFLLESFFHASPGSVFASICVTQQKQRKVHRTCNLDLWINGACGPRGNHAKQAKPLCHVCAFVEKVDAQRNCPTHNEIMWFLRTGLHPTSSPKHIKHFNITQTSSNNENMHNTHNTNWTYLKTIRFVGGLKIRNNQSTDKLLVTCSARGVPETPLGSKMVPKPSQERLGAPQDPTSPICNGLYKCPWFLHQLLWFSRFFVP